MILFLVLSACLVHTAGKSFSLTKNENIAYSEIGTVDYKVYLKDNNFYDTPYLEKGMAYVTSLIDKIRIKYNYTFQANVESNIDVEYQVLARLIITSQSNSSVFYEKEFELTKPIIDEIAYKKQYIIDRDVDIDYQYYNNLANQFKSNYAVNTSSRLDVYLQVKEKEKEENSYEVEASNDIIISIPLSEQEISIQIPDMLKNDKQIIQECKFEVENIGYVLLSIIIIIVLFIVLTSLLSQIFATAKKEKSAYDKYIRRLLLGYDRIIVNVKAAPNQQDYNVIEVESFEELVDARDNTKEPINYHIMAEHQESEFFVINDNNMYLYIVKATDFNEEKKNG